MKASLPIAVLSPDPGTLARDVELQPRGRKSFELGNSTMPIDEVVVQNGSDLLEHGDYSVGKF